MNKISLGVSILIKIICGGIFFHFFVLWGTQLKGRYFTNTVFAPSEVHFAGNGFFDTEEKAKAIAGKMWRSLLCYPVEGGRGRELRGGACNGRHQTGNKSHPKIRGRRGQRQSPRVAGIGLGKDGGITPPPPPRTSIFALFLLFLLLDGRLRAQLWGGRAARVFHALRSFCGEPCWLSFLSAFVALLTLLRGEKGLDYNPLNKYC